MLREFTVSSLGKRVVISPLSQEEGGGLLQSPFRIFPRTIFAFLLRLPYGQFTHPLSRYPCIYEKKFQTFCREKSCGVGGWGGGGGSEGGEGREGVAAKINKFS